MAVQQLRLALAEIPERMDALRVTDTMFHVIPHVDNTTNVAMAEEQHRELSPDELMIRQRGRRRYTNSWSMENAAAAAAATPIRGPFQRTPTKKPLLTTGMILRSSPRKRLTMGSTPPDTACNPTAWEDDALMPSTPTSPKMKKLRSHEACCTPVARMSEESPLRAVLKGLSQDQLVELIVNELVGEDGNTERKLRAHLPMADIEPLKQELAHAKHNIFKSLPTSRLISKTDSSAFKRASVHLTEFKRLLNAHLEILQKSCHWDALLDYVIVAWPYVRATPIWECAAHNTVRRQCFKQLSNSCVAAISSGGLHLGIERLRTLERDLEAWGRDFKDVSMVMNELNRVLAKGRKTL